jgi:tRNA-uridine 2-sulfurtransferase
MEPPHDQIHGEWNSKIGRLRNSLVSRHLRRFTRPMNRQHSTACGLVADEDCPTQLRGSTEAPSADLTPSTRFHRSAKRRPDPLDRDLSKDQTYFLFELTQEQLAHAEFPLGELTKPEVRELAREAGLAVASKKESYEICFVPQRDGYSSIIENEARAMASEGDGLATAVAEGDAGGEIVDQDGRVLGHHDGYYHFTIGQRRGLQIGGLPERTYVIDVNPWTRRVVVGPESALEETELYCERTHWISGENPEGPVEVWARVRSRAAEIDAVVEPLGDGMSRVRFRAPVRAAAPGQAVVFYRDDLCLGGGWITRAQGSGSGSHGPGAGD